MKHNSLTERRFVQDCISDAAEQARTILPRLTHFRDNHAQGSAEQQAVDEAISSIDQAVGMLYEAVGYLGS